MSKRKHPQDRAERLKINEEKKASNGRGNRIKTVSDGLVGTVSPDIEDI